jgi:hypothetical protein
MKRMLQICIYSILMTLPLPPAYASTENATNGGFPLHPIDAGVRVELNSQGEEIYYRKLEAGFEEEITQVEFKSSIETSLEKCLKIACKLSMIPNSVSISIGFGVGSFNITWNLNDNLCKKYQPSGELTGSEPS